MALVALDLAISRRSTSGTDTRSGTACGRGSGPTCARRSAAETRRLAPAAGSCPDPPKNGAETAHEIAERMRTAIAGSPRPALTSAAPPAWPSTRWTPRAPTRSCSWPEGALYWAKRSGKSRTRLFDPDHVRLSGDAPQRSEILRILDERAIAPLYQPVGSLTTGRLIGYEALARFPDAPERPPSTWFAQANAWASAPSWRPLRSGPHSSRSAVRRAPPRDQRQPLGPLDRRRGEERPPRRPLGPDHRADRARGVRRRQAASRTRSPRW